MPAANVYLRPSLPMGTVLANLTPEGMDGQELTPKTRVIVVNRGAHPYTDKFDGRNYTVPPLALAEVEYEVANHFRERSIVPGTRDPITGRQEHYIAIIGIDDEDHCALLVDAEQAKADGAIEALDRSMMDGADADVRIVNTNAARARMVGRGTRRVVQSAESNDGKETAPDALTAPVGGDAMRQIARDAAEKANA